MMRRFLVCLTLVTGAIFSLPQVGGATSSQAPPSPSAVWGSVLFSAQTPQGGMAWDGQHLWANTGSTVTEVWTNSFSNGNAKNRTLDLAAHDFSGQGLPAAMAMIGNHLFMTGMIVSTGHAGIAEIDPLGSPPRILRTYDLQALAGPSVGAIMLQSSVVSGSSMVLVSSAGTLWRFTPAAGTMTQITGVTGFPTSVALSGDRLWVGTTTGGTPIAAYGFTQETSSLGAPVVAITSPSTGVTALSADSSFLWAIQGGAVTKVNLADGSVMARGIPAGVTPTGIASDGTWVWVADPSANPAALIGLNAKTPSASTSIALIPPPPTTGGAISGVFFDGTDVWSAEVIDGTIEQLKLYPSPPVVSKITETGTGSVHFTFTPPGSSGNASTLTYELLVDGPSTSDVVASPPNPSGNTVRGLLPGGHYCFTIGASNGPFMQRSAPSCITLSASATTSTTTTSGGGLANTGASFDLIVMLGCALSTAGIVLITRRRRVA